jgi:hypothetical protein
LHGKGNEIKLEQSWVGTTRISRAAILDFKKQRQARTPPCVRLFCIIDTLTSASVLPGVDGNIEELPEKSRLIRSRSHCQYVKALRAPAVLPLGDGVGIK